MEPPRTPWAPTEPKAWGDAPAARATTRKGRITSTKTRRERGDNANGSDKRDRRKEKGGGHSQDIARGRQQGPPPKRTRTPPRRSEGWNGRATPTGPQTEEHTRDRCRNPGKGRTLEREPRTLKDSRPP